GLGVHPRPGARGGGARRRRRRPPPRRNAPPARAGLAAQIANDLDDPAQVAGRAIERALWGDDHPYGHTVDGSIPDVEAFTRGDAVGFHQARFGPRASVLVVVGGVLERSVRAAVVRVPWRRE